MKTQKKFPLLSIEVKISNICDDLHNAENTVIHSILRQLTQLVNIFTFSLIDSVLNSMKIFSYIARSRNGDVLAH